MTVYAYENLLNQAHKLLTNSKLANFLQQYPICSLGSLKLNCRQQNSIVCISLLLNSFIRKRLTMKSRQLSCDFVQCSMLLTHRVKSAYIWR